MDLGVGLGISSSSADSDAEAEDDALPPPPREVVMGAGGLLTPSATRSGGRRVGKRTFHIDPAELDARTCPRGGEEDEGDDELLPVKLQGKWGRSQ